MSDSVDHPPHYNKVPGIECIDVVENFSFNRGNAIKYIWRAGDKGAPAQEVEDLRKAIWYIEREIASLVKNNQPILERKDAEDLVTTMKLMGKHTCLDGDVWCPNDCNCDCGNCSATRYKLGLTGKPA